MTVPKAAQPRQPSRRELRAVVPTRRWALESPRWEMPPGSLSVPSCCSPLWGLSQKHLCHPAQLVWTLASLSSETW